MNTAYYIQAIAVDPEGVEHEGRWFIRALSMEDACRKLIHRLAANNCHVRYYIQVKPRGLKP